jgi:homoserine O-acetyltransferase
LNADLRAIDDADLNPVHIAALPSPFALWRGGSLTDGVIAYESWGELNPDASNAILLFTGLSPTAHAASSPANREPGWWEQMIGPGRAIDTDRHFVV